MHCDCQQAVKALKNNNNDIVNAIMVREWLCVICNCKSLVPHIGTHHVMMMRLCLLLHRALLLCMERLCFDDSLSGFDDNNEVLPCHIALT